LKNLFGVKVKHIIHLALILPVLALVGCGGKKADPSTSMSNQFKLDPFIDVNNPSTLDLDKLKNLPRIIDLKNIMTPAKNQSDRGSCSFFSTIAVVESAIKRKMNVEVNLSEEYLNYAVKSQGFAADQEGGNPNANLYFLQKGKTGFLLEKDWPYQPSWFEVKKPCMEFSPADGNAPAECFSHSSPPKANLEKMHPLENFILKGYKATSTNELIEGLAEGKEPMTINVAVNRSGWADDGQVHYTEQMRQDCIDKKVECGGHSIVLTGYDMDKQVFFFKNSWGQAWGKDGFGTITFDFIDRYAKQSGVFIQLEKDLKLPEDYNVENYKFKKFTVESPQNHDFSLTINTSTQLENSELYTITQTARLVKVPAVGYYSPSDENTTIVEPTAEESVKLETDYIGDYKYFYADSTSTDFNLKSFAHALKIPQAEMELRSVEKIRYSGDEKLLVRTSLNIFTDEGYKVLKRYYHPFNFKPLK
jgi:subtilisin-like proprotein convertase family protein